MKDANKRPWRSILVYFVFALTFALLAALVGSFPAQHALRFAFRQLLGIDASWLFWVIVALAVGFTLPLLWSVVAELSARQLLPSFLSRWFSQEARSIRGHILLDLARKAHSLGGRLIAAGVAIFLIVWLL